jgi:hypothetical protein
LIVVINNPDVTVGGIAKRSEDKWRDKVTKLLQLALGITVGREDVRHTARPLHGVHPVVGETSVSRAEVGGRGRDVLVS